MSFVPMPILFHTFGRFMLGHTLGRYISCQCIRYLMCTQKLCWSKLPYNLVCLGQNISPIWFLIAGTKLNHFSEFVEAFFHSETVDMNSPAKSPLIGNRCLASKTCYQHALAVYWNIVEQNTWRYLVIYLNPLDVLHDIPMTPLNGNMQSYVLSLTKFSY